MDTDALQRYRPQEYAAIEAAPARALMAELRRLAVVLETTHAVMRKLEARMVAHGF